MQIPIESLFSSVSGTGWAAGAELASLFLFARANTLWRSEGMTHAPLAMLLIRSMVALGIVVLLTWGLGGSLPGWGQWYTEQVWTVVLGMFGGLGLLLLAMSLSALPSRLVFFGGTIHLFFGGALGYFLLGEALNTVRVSVMLLLAFAQGYLLFADRQTWLGLPRSKRWIPFLVGLIWGTYYPLLGLLQPEFGVWNTLVLTEYGVFLTIALAFLVHVKSQLHGLKTAIHYRQMGEQAILSIFGQVFSALCISWGGVVLQSILTNFNSLINVSAFRLRFGEKFDWRYMVFFLAYGALMVLLVFAA